jgi:hypothetical protein
VPLPRVMRDQQRSLRSPVTVYPQVDTLARVTTLIAGRPSKLAMRFASRLLIWSASRRDRLCVQLPYLVWLLCTVELSIFHRPSSAASP